ncbi:MAG: aspartate kinase [Bacteroidales bacterium]|nr:aspartate kinase [Bacteroidales bacterium]
MKVFKFGGASVNSAEAVRNMVSIVRQEPTTPLLVVVSAMGKTTNLLEKLVPGVVSPNERTTHLSQLSNYHQQIIDELFPHGCSELHNAINGMLQRIAHLSSAVPTSYNYDYDQIVSYGELLSTTIIAAYMKELGINAVWVDVRKLIYTDSTYREGRVEWKQTSDNVQSKLLPLMHNNIVITQGFIAGTADGSTTTLGREGSDYSASILSFCLGAESMTIWKDVAGFLNADPKFFSNTVKIDHLPYNEAIELAYYGASVIHPKTVKPIQNKSINLYIKSFVDPSMPGSTIGNFDSISPQTPLYIFKRNQILISILPKDFSFIAEDNLQTIFAALAHIGIRVNLMQNSALSFSLCIDNNEVLINQLQEILGDHYHLRYNTDLELITIRYYTANVIQQIVGNRQVLLQQRSRITAQLVVSDTMSIAL